MFEYKFIERISKVLSLCIFKMWLNKTAVVTGASAGIGAAIVKDFISAGINVVRLDKSLTNLKPNAGKSPAKVYSFKCDVSDQKSVKETFKLIEEELGTVNILINNAGVGRWIDTSMKSWIVEHNFY